MTREEQIAQANPMRLSPSEYEDWVKGETVFDHRASYSEDFEEGAEWADKNPNWRLCSEEMPSDMQYNIVSIKMPFGYATTVAWWQEEKGKWWFANIPGRISELVEVGVEVVAWMPLPFYKPKK